MKRMYVTFAGLFLLCMSAVNVKAADDIKTKVKGKWEVTVPDAPSRFQKFTFTFKEKDGTVLLDLKNGEFDLKDQKCVEKDGKLTVSLYIDDWVNILIWEEKDEIKGSADTSIGVIPMKLKKVENEK